MSNPFISAALGALGGAFGAWLISRIPGVRAWVTTQFEKRQQVSVLVVSGLIATAISMLSLFAYQKQFIFSGFETKVVYQCPNNQDVEGAPPFAWVSIGCVGHFSSVPECQNIGWNSTISPATKAATVKKQACSRVGILKYDPADK